MSAEHDLNPPGCDGEQCVKECLTGILAKESIPRTSWTKAKRAAAARGAGERPPDGSAAAARGAGERPPDGRAAAARGAGEKPPVLDWDEAMRSRSLLMKSVVFCIGGAVEAKWPPDY